jgi:hypothetical protein
VTDHSPGETAWKRTLRILEEYNEPDQFITVPGWEWSAIPGHVNVYLQSAEVDAGPAVSWTTDRPTFGHFDEGAPTFSNIDWPEDSIVVPHHTNAVGPGYWEAFDWSSATDRYRLVEMNQVRGSFETDQVDESWGVLTGGQGASVRDGLAAGHRLGFVGGTDNHEGYPTRSASGAGYVGMTGFVTDKLSRESVWNAMNDRRVYATTGVPIVCHFTVNGQLMGSEGRVSDDEAVTFDARLYGTSSIERVEVVSNGDTVWGADPDVRDFEISDEPIETGGRSGYYYLRLRQADEHMAWTSPVWLDRDE